MKILQSNRKDSFIFDNLKIKSININIFYQENKIKKIIIEISRK